MNSQNSKIEFRNLFLKEFIRITLSNINIPRTEKIILPNTEKKIEIPHNDKNVLHPSIKQNLQIIPIPKQEIKVQEIKQGQIENKFPQNNSPPVYPDLDFGKINFLLRDLRAEKIECSGPEKPVMVIKNGQYQKTNISLNKDEINEIIKTFSSKTRIPIVGGLLKAAYKNIILSSVSSEFVGTKFVIQKKNPFQPLII